MMPAIETTDWLALKERADTLITDPVMQVFEPGEIITPPKDATGPVPHILLSDVVNEPERRGIDPRLHVRSGTFLATMHWPIALAVTHTQLKEIQGQIAAHFAAGTCMTYGPSRLRVTQDAATPQPFVEGAYRIAVVSVPWSSM